ncbi:MAG: DUF4398 domain-containing protein [Deltaproteobacteria bacterium]|nr:DUF4398 domain-containing protein [Deltaproteobacteria bacterium]
MIRPELKILFFLMVIGAAGCGPIEYMSQVGLKANREFSGAKEAKAEKYSPYEYWSAFYYLGRARHKAGYGDYQDAVRYGEKSQKMSDTAQKISVNRMKVDVDLGKSDTEKKDPSVEQDKKPQVLIIKKNEAAK